MKTLARVGMLETPRGTFETPILFPVHNAGVRRDGNSPEYWNEIPDMKTMMLNAYFIKNNSIYYRLVKKGLHKYFNMDGLFFVDSGGFQSRLYNLKIEPIEILRVQEQIGSDIASTLDIPIYPEDHILKNQHAKYIKMSVENALKCLKNREREEMKLYASIHGNEISVLLNTIDYLNRRGNFDGFAIGGLVAKRNDLYQLIDLILSVKKHIGDKQLHVFGLGGPSIIPLLVYIGVDSFDSSSFLTAGSNRIYYMPERGSIKFREMPELHMLPCVCPVCSKSSFEEIRSQRKLIALHNLWTITYELRKLKLSIKEGDLEQYLDNRFVHNPLIKNAYQYAKARVRGLS